MSKKDLVLFNANDVRIERTEVGTLVVSSRIIAEQLGKRHSDMLEQIDKILENGDFRSLIIASTYEVSGQSRKYKEYLLTEEGFTLYMFNIQGYNEFKLAYINEFERMQNDLNNPYKVPTNFTEALQLALDLQKEKVQLTIENAEMKPKAEFVDNTFIPREGSILVRDFAKLIYNAVTSEFGEKKLYEFLRQNKLVTKANTPMQKYVEMGIFEMKNSSNNGTRLVTYITNKGQTYLYNKIKESEANKG